MRVSGPTNTPHARIGAPTRSRPIGSIERAVADRLRDVGGAYLFRPVEVGDGAAHFQDAVVGPRRQTQTCHRLLQHALALRTNPAVLADQARRHLRVREDALARQALALPPARRYHSLTYARRAFAFGRCAVGELLEAHRGDVYVDVYTVEQRPRDAVDVALNLEGRAAALVGRVSPIATHAGVHGGREHEGGREGQRHRRAADRHAPVFERLAQDFEDGAVELGQLVEEEHPVVRQGDFAGARDGPAADQPRVADRVVRRAERPLGDQPRAPGQPGDRMNLRQLQRGLEFERRQDRRQALRQHRLARARRAYQ